MEYNVSFYQGGNVTTERVVCDQIYIDNGILHCDSNDDNLVAAFTAWIKVLPA